MYYKGGLFYIQPGNQPLQTGNIYDVFSQKNSTGRILPGGQILLGGQILPGG